jgi:hypothetical protein
MQVSLANLAVDQLKVADVIEAIDPRRPSYRQQVWGQGVVLPMRPYPSGPHTLQVLEVEIDSSQSDQLQDLLRQVESAKGCLHPDVEKLKN